MVFVSLIFTKLSIDFHFAEWIIEKCRRIKKGVPYETKNLVMYMAYLDD